MRFSRLVFPLLASLLALGNGDAVEIRIATYSVRLGLGTGGDLVQEIGRTGGTVSAQPVPGGYLGSDLRVDPENQRTDPVPAGTDKSLHPSLRERYCWHRYLRYPVPQEPEPGGSRDQRHP